MMVVCWLLTSAVVCSLHDIYNSDHSVILCAPLVVGG